MTTSNQIIIALLSGALLGLVFAVVAFAIRRYTRQLLAVGVFLAALAYVWFALQAHTSLLWLGVELGGVCLYGVAGLLGLRGSAWWLAAAWALHPLWDVVLHYMGPGNSFAPLVEYVIPCLGFDLVVAAFTAYKIARASHPAIKAASR